MSLFIPIILYSDSGIVLLIMIFPVLSKLMRPESNRASRLAESKKPLYTFKRSLSFAHSAQGFMWLARNSSGRLIVLTAQQPFQYLKSARLKTSCCVVLQGALFPFISGLWIGRFQFILKISKGLFRERDKQFCSSS